MLTSPCRAHAQRIGLVFFLWLTCTWGIALEARPDFAPGQLLVRFKDSADSREVGTFAKAQGFEIAQRFRTPRGANARGALVLYTSRRQSMAAMRSAAALHSTVLYAEPNYTRELSALPDDPEFDRLWGLHNTGQNVNGSSGTADADINYPEAWALARPLSAEVVVGVADTGMSVRHPDLSDNLWTNPGEIAENGIDDDANGYIDDVHGYDFGTGTFRMVDNDNHGTHVAGTIGASTDNGIGISGVHGHVKLLPLKVESDDGSLYTSDIIEAFLYAVDLKNSGVNLVAINASFGGPSFTQAEYEAIADMNAAGIILCAAAGNEGANNETTPSYPANYDLPNIISTAATDSDNELASFSNYGSTTVDLAAPGVNIYSTLPLNFIAYTSSLLAGGTGYSVATLEHGGTTPVGGLTAEVVHCGLGHPGDFPAAVDDNIALIQRGTLTFAEKVANAMAAGAVGALIYNHENKPAGAWTLGHEDDWIPALQLTKSDGEDLLAALPSSATLTNTGDLTTAYQFLNGTSMATPHVAGAVAFAALNFPDDNLAERVDRILDNVTPVPALSGLMVTGGVLNLQKLVDSDSDQLGDWWEEDYFGNLDHDGSGNSDGDPFTDAEEFLSLTDPTSGSSALSLAPIAYDPTSGATLQFQSAPGRSYQVHWRESLAVGFWQILQSGIEGDGSLIEVTDPGAAGADHRFYKLEIVE